MNQLMRACKAVFRTRRSANDQDIEKLARNALARSARSSTIASSAEMLRKILDSSPDCVKILDLEANLVWMSEHGRRAMQVDDVRQVDGTPWLDFWKGEDRVAAEGAVARAVAGGSGRFTGFCPTRKGEPRYWDVVLTSLYDADGKPAQLLAVSRDISESKRVEAKLLSHRVGLDEAQRVAQMGSWEFNAVTGELSSSKQLRRILGWPIDAELTYKDALKLVHGDDIVAVRAAVEHALARRGPLSIDFRIVHADRSIRTFTARGEMIIGDASQADRLIGVCRDITESNRSEKMAAGQRDILAGIAAQHALSGTLERIVRLHEETNPGSLCSLRLLDESGSRFLQAVAPSLPEEFNRAVHGQKVGHESGSCGAAARTRQRVVVEDIATDPEWFASRELALGHGLCACWSTPIIGSGNQLLGVFSVFYRETRLPHRVEMDGVDQLLAITTIAMESARLIDRLRVRDRFFEMSLEIFCVYDPDNERFVQVNPAFCNITGYSSAEMTSRHYLQFVHPDDRGITAGVSGDHRAIGNEAGEFVNRYLCRNGGYRLLQWIASTADDGLVYAAGRDITEQSKASSELAHAINHDAITGLPHHQAFERNLVSLLGRRSRSLWILFIGLDHFHAINESMGHDIGDEVLQHVAVRLREAVGESGEIAHFAGDEFVVSVAGQDEVSVFRFAEHLRAAIARPIEGDDYQLLLSASVGISRSPDHGSTPKELLRRAEAAMMLAKRQGRDCTRGFCSEQMREIEDRLVLGRYLRGAIRRGEFQLHYQPQHTVQGGFVSGFEALLRWESATLGQVPPSRFIPVAEVIGLMPEIGAWVFNEACRQARAWLDRGHRGFEIWVNVAAPQLLRSGLVAQVRDALDRHGVSPGMLGIELTESSLMENVDRVGETLIELKSLGISLALDDFGTGYSSLAYLKQFPIDKLKIDQSFVRGLPDDDDDAVIARTIVAMAHQLRMRVSAEGVESQAQADFLTEIGCDELQGFLMGRPTPAIEAAGVFPGMFEMDPQTGASGAA